MGVTNNAVQRIRKWFSADKEADIAKLKRGEDNVPATSGVYHNGYDDLSDSLRLEDGLLNRYSDYEEMDDYPEIGSALDIYADDATVPDSLRNRSVWATSNDVVVTEILDDLLHKRLRIEEEIYPIARTLTKYGNNFAEILADKNGVVGLNYLPVPTVRRIETPQGTLLGFAQNIAGRFTISQEGFKKMLSGVKDKGGSVAFEPWEVVHWRLRGKNVSSPYGFSVLDTARWIWRRLVMAEDSALVYKLTRAPARFAFYVDVGDLPPAQAVAYVNQVKQQFKKKKLFNPSTGKLDFRMNPLSPEEDFWIPTRQGQESTRIDVISGPDFQSVEDLEYFRSKLFSAIKVPKAYLGIDGDSSRSSLAQEDVRFARTVMRIQREIRNGLKEVCRIHLAAIGVDPDQIEFDVKMTVPSAIFELAQIELRNAQADNAERLATFFPKEWVLKRVFDFSDEVAVAVSTAKKDEVYREARREAETQASIIRDYPEVAGMEQEIPMDSMVASTNDRDSKKLFERLDDLLAKMEYLEDNHGVVVARLDEIAPVVKDIRRRRRRGEDASKSRRTG